MLMNYNELYEILKENFEKEGNFKTIEDLNVTIETIHFHSKKQIYSMVLFLPHPAKNTKHISRKVMKIKYFMVFPVFM